jgi:hypothetical protein
VHWTIRIASYISKNINQEMHLKDTKVIFVWLNKNIFKVEKEVQHFVFKSRSSWHVAAILTK